MNQPMSSERRVPSWQQRTWRSMGPDRSVVVQPRHGRRACTEEGRVVSAMSDAIAQDIDGAAHSDFQLERVRNLHRIGQPSSRQRTELDEVNAALTTTVVRFAYGPVSARAWPADCVAGAVITAVASENLANVAFEALSSWFWRISCREKSVRSLSLLAVPETRMAASSWRQVLSSLASFGRFAE